MRQIARHYGAHPLHLLTLVASFALAGYAAQQLISNRPVMTVVWFVGAAVGHDLVLFPLYGLVDVALMRVGRRVPERLPAPTPAGNYVRVPLLLSGLLLIVFAPSILQRSPSYEATTLLRYDRFVQNWLLISGGLFLTSAVVYALRLRSRRVLR